MKPYFLSLSETHHNNYNHLGSNFWSLILTIWSYHNLILNIFTSTKALLKPPMIRYNNNTLLMDKKPSHRRLQVWSSHTLWRNNPWFGIYVSFFNKKQVLDDYRQSGGGTKERELKFWMGDKNKFSILFIIVSSESPFEGHKMKTSLSLFLS